MTAIYQSHPTRLAEVARYLALVSRPDEYLDSICAQAARAFSVPMATARPRHTVPEEIAVLRDLAARVGRELDTRLAEAERE